MNPVLKQLRFVRRGLVGAIVVAGLFRAASAAATELEPGFPPSIEAEQLQAWLRRDTDIAPNHVAYVTDGALLAVMQVRETAIPPGYQMTVRGEILDPELAQKERMLSWYVQVEVDCRGRRMRQGALVGYRGRNLLGENRVVRPASAAWLAPSAGSGLAAVWSAACDEAFRWPLVGHSEVIAQGGRRSVDDTPDRGRAPAGQTAAKEPNPASGRSPEKAKSPVKPVPPQVADAEPGQGYSVQLGALSSEKAAQEVLDRQEVRGAALRAHAKPEVQRATVNGKVYYRAMLVGMSRRQATELCASHAAQRDCLVRSSPASTAQVATKLPQLRPSKK